MGEYKEHLGQSDHVDPLKSSANLNFSMLPKGQPHPENHLGSAKDPHTLRIFNEPHRDPAGALGTNYPQPRMLLRSQELYEPIPERDYRESLYESPLPHGALLLLFLCSTKGLLSLFKAEGRRLPLSHVYPEATRCAAWLSGPRYPSPQVLQPPGGAGKYHRCRAASATRAQKRSPVGLRMRLQMGLRMRLRMGSQRRSPKESSSRRLRTP